MFFNVDKSISLDQRKTFELTKFSFIQRNFFFDRISKKCFFDSKKLISQCLYFATAQTFIFLIQRKKTIKKFI